INSPSDACSLPSVPTRSTPAAWISARTPSTPAAARSVAVPSHKSTLTWLKLSWAIEGDATSKPITFQRSDSNASAIAFPMPELEPVTMARLRSFGTNVGLLDDHRGLRRVFLLEAHNVFDGTRVSRNACSLSFASHRRRALCHFGIEALGMLAGRQVPYQMQNSNPSTVSPLPFQRLSSPALATALRSAAISCSEGGSVGGRTVGASSTPARYMAIFMRACASPVGSPPPYTASLSGVITS